MSLKDFKVINKLGKTYLNQVILKEKEHIAMFIEYKEFQIINIMRSKKLK